MRQDVNLYTEAFRPSQEWLTLSFAARCSVAALLIVAIIGGWTQYQVLQLRDEQQQLEQEQARTQDVIAGLNEQLAQQQRDPELENQVERLEERAADRKRLVERAGSVARASNEGFTPYLEGLAKQSREGLWLTRIQVNLLRDRLHLQGETVQGQHVPNYLQRLREEPVFEGRRFERFGIERTDQSAFLEFDVASRRNSGGEED
ncbi:hypothetical protein DES49_2929 [Halospina denitrificans]|uniref:MSHA biogenesis protein MshI n=1 Tax=Halospina denitrificans TaxID=332522 RepID=A0A4R7JIV8_9GAMM|nr:PilN domain-containing protein [Halospina denitrificans]TDT36977.1 hypothetical protein DES49_2929 [Halospina denitrificans]